jgi:transcriptional regulator with XRE-family HTH domain
VAQTSPTFRRRRLARRLRQMREQANMTLDAAAPRLDKTRSSLARVETGQSRADVHLIRSMMDLYDHYDPDLLDLARAANKPGWWTKYDIEDRGFIDMETEASISQELTLVYVPGLLQTEAYMRAVFSNGRMQWSEKRLRNEVAARMVRQRRLVDDEFPLAFAAIVDEAALRKKVGGAEAMRQQLRRLIECAELPTVSLQVLPDEIGAHIGMDGAYTILTFPEADEPEVMYVEYMTGALQIESPQELAEAKLVLQRLRSHALSPAESVSMIERLA